MDECLTDNGGCSQTCTNTDGSYTCSCPDGYTTPDNGVTCNGMYVAKDHKILFQKRNVNDT